MRKTIGAAVLAGSFAIALSTEARADVVLSGPDTNDGSYSSATLAAVATASDTVSSGGVTGISLWGFLGGANAASPASPTYGAITTSMPVGDNGKNAILHDYLLATSSSGAKSVFSLGEIDPAFGGTAPIPAFIAFKTASNTLLAAPQLVVPGVSGRSLSNVTSLQLLAAPALAAGPGGISTSVKLTGSVTNPGTYTQSDLKTKFTPATKTISGDTYTGVPLWTFLGAQGSSTDKIVVTMATDGYEVVLALAELDPALGGNPDDLLPYADTGTDFPADGVARTILPLDNKHGRWESNLDAVDVEAVPEPGSLALFASALASLALVTRRRGGIMRDAMTHRG
jgi:hypothetical protein